MRYQARHRRLPHPHRLRAGVTALGVAGGSLVVPMTVADPAVAQVPAAAISFADHPEWRLAASDGAAARAIDDLVRELGGESGCRTEDRSIKISSGDPVEVGFDYGFSVTTCETYMPKGYDDQGHWSNKWNYNHDLDEDGVGYGKSGTFMRHVGLTMGVKTTATDKTPSWSVLTGTEVTTNHWYN